MSYLDRVFENSSEVVTIPNPVIFSSTLKMVDTLSPSTSDGAALGSTSLMWSDLFLASGGVINFNNGDVTITHSSNLLTLGGGGLSVGADGAGFDVIFYGDTSGCDFFWDQNGDTNGALSLGATGGSKGVDFTAYGATNGNYLKWDQSANSLLLTGTSTVLNIAGTTASTSSTTGALICAGGVGIAGPTYHGGTLTVGVNDTGYDVKFFGATAGCYMLYDESEDTLSLVQTNAATTGVERTLTISQTHTGIGASAEALAVTLTTNTIGGTYQNAIFGKLNFGTTGGVTGLAGVVCGELTMPGGTIAGGVGTYVVFEAEINCPASYDSTVPIVAWQVNAWGDAVAKFDDYGYLFEITGVTSGATSLWYDNQKAAPAVEEFIRVKTPAGVRYLGLYNTNA